MTYYQLPRTNIYSFKYIDCIEKESLPETKISFSLSEFLYEIKKKIETIEKDWDIFKKYTNPYEYIHTHLPYKKKCVASYSPLSRSYFKMIELLKTFRLEMDSKPIRSFHLAEGPGGFIEALCKVRKCPYDTYTGITIIDENNTQNVPGWKKTKHFLNQNKNVLIEYGQDKTGDILSIDNFVYCKEKYGSSMDLITGDGGFDFSEDFNNQEVNIAALLFAQIAFALCLQKKNGKFVLKIFDSFMQHTIDLLYILSSFYEKVYIAKPYTSRYANSEKYIVCKGFLFENNDKFYPYIHRAFEKMVNNTNNNATYIHRFLNMPTPSLFTSKMEEINSILGQQQIENIHYTLSLIDNKHKQEKIDSIIKNNIQKCMNWCNKNNVPYNAMVD